MRSVNTCFPTITVFQYVSITFVIASRGRAYYYLPMTHLYAITFSSQIALKKMSTEQWFVILHGGIWLLFAPRVSYPEVWPVPLSMNFIKGSNRSVFGNHPSLVTFTEYVHTVHTISYNPLLIVVIYTKEISACTYRPRLVSYCIYVAQLILHLTVYANSLLITVLTAPKNFTEILVRT